MFKKHRTEVTQREYHGLRSHIFLQQDDPPGTNLAITWVDVPPGARQMLKQHGPEQVYVIIQGTGRMHVGEEEEDVVTGDLIHIPSNVLHAIENRSEDMLSYVSAATPAFDIALYYDQPPQAETRSRPLIIAGPSGTKKRIAAAMEVFFPGSSQVQQRFLVDIRELAPEQSSTFGEVAVTPYPVQHPSGDPSLALRIACAGKTLTYTGDTQWTEMLSKACRGADLLIAEAYFFEKQVPFHLDPHTLLAHLDELQPKRLVLTHMSDDMLSRLEELPCDYAEDGTCIEV